jgi:hypothetical protein
MPSLIIQLPYLGSSRNLTLTGPGFRMHREHWAINRKWIADRIPIHIRVLETWETKQWAAVRKMPERWPKILIEPAHDALREGIALQCLRQLEENPPSDPETRARLARLAYRLLTEDARGTHRAPGDDGPTTTEESANERPK